ncbi:MAG: ankyrin repeat domain-containing protein [Elusimicrobiota bacterium]
MKRLNARILSYITLLTFVSTLLNDFAWAQALPAPSQTLILPEQYGKITERYTGKSAQRIICVQDLHCHPEVQRNINEIINSVKEQFGDNFQILGLEGTPGNVDTSLLGNIPDQEIKKKVLDYFIDKGDISGPEIYTILHPNTMQLIGIEDAELYFHNFALLSKSLSYRKLIDNVINNIRFELNRIKVYLYPDDLKAFDLRKTIYSEGRETLFTYVRFLKETAAHLNIPFELEYPQLENYLKTNEYKRKLNPQNISKEADYIFAQLQKLLNVNELRTLEKYSKGDAMTYYKYLNDFLKKHKIDISQNYKDMSLYFRYLEHNAQIDEIKIVEEKEQLEYKIRRSMVATRPDATKVMEAERILNLLHGYVWNKSSSQDVEEWRASKYEFYDLLTQIGNRMLSENYFQKSIDIIDRAEENMLDFYIDAVKRNEILTKNILSNGNKSPIKLIVIGGFHAQGIKDALKSRGVSYDLVIPNLTEMGEEDLYLKRVIEQRNWLESDRAPTLAKEIMQEREALMVLSKFYTGELTVEVMEQITLELLNTYDFKTAQEITTLFNRFMKEYFKDDPATKIAIEIRESLTQTNKINVDISITGNYVIKGRSLPVITVHRDSFVKNDAGSYSLYSPTPEEPLSIETTTEQIDSEASDFLRALNITNFPISELLSPIIGDKVVLRGKDIISRSFEMNGNNIQIVARGQSGANELILINNDLVLPKNIVIQITTSGGRVLSGIARIDIVDNNLRLQIGYPGSDLIGTRTIESRDILQAVKEFEKRSKTEKPAAPGRTRLEEIELAIKDIQREKETLSMKRYLCELVEKILNSSLKLLPAQENAIAKDTTAVLIANKLQKMREQVKAFILQSTTWEGIEVGGSLHFQLESLAEEFLDTIIAETIDEIRKRGPDSISLDDIFFLIDSKLTPEYLIERGVSNNKLNQGLLRIVLTGSLQQALTEQIIPQLSPDVNLVSQNLEFQNTIREFFKTNIRALLLKSGASPAQAEKIIYDLNAEINKLISPELITEILQETLRSLLKELLIDYTLERRTDNVFNELLSGIIAEEIEDQELREIIQGTRQDTEGFAKVIRTISTNPNLLELISKNILTEGALSGSLETVLSRDKLQKSLGPIVASQMALIASGMEKDLKKGLLPGQQESLNATMLSSWQLRQLFKETSLESVISNANLLSLFTSASLSPKISEVNPDNITSAIILQPENLSDLLSGTKNLFWRFFIAYTAKDKTDSILRAGKDLLPVRIMKNPSVGEFQNSLLAKSARGEIGVLNPGNTIAGSILQHDPSARQEGNFISEKETVSLTGDLDSQISSLESEKKDLEEGREYSAPGFTIETKEGTIKGYILEDNLHLDILGINPNAETAYRTDIRRIPDSALRAFTISLFNKIRAGETSLTDEFINLYRIQTKQPALSDDDILTHALYSPSNIAATLRVLSAVLMRDVYADKIIDAIEGLSKDRYNEPTLSDPYYLIKAVLLSLGEIKLNEFQSLVTQVKKEQWIAENVVPLYQSQIQIPTSQIGLFELEMLSNYFGMKKIITTKQEEKMVILAENDLRGPISILVYKKGLFSYVVPEEERIILEEIGRGVSKGIVGALIDIQNTVTTLFSPVSSPRGNELVKVPTIGPTKRVITSITRAQTVTIESLLNALGMEIMDSIIRKKITLNSDQHRSFIQAFGQALGRENMTITDIQSWLDENHIIENQALLGSILRNTISARAQGSQIVEDPERIIEFVAVYFNSGIILRDFNTKTISTIGAKDRASQLVIEKDNTGRKYNRLARLTPDEIEELPPADRAEIAAQEEAEETGAEVEIAEEEAIKPEYNDEVFNLHKTAKQGSKEEFEGTYGKLIRKYLDYGDLLSIPDNNGNLPMHNAAGAGNSAVAEYLLERINFKKFTNAQNADGRTPLMLAIMNGRINVIHLLLDIDQDTTRPLTDISIKDNAGNTALHYAVMHNDFNTAERLLALGANVNAQNSEGNTPMHLALLADTINSDLIKLLLDQTDSSIKNTAGQTIKKALESRDDKVKGKKETQTVFETQETQSIEQEEIYKKNKELVFRDIADYKKQHIISNPILRVLFDPLFVFVSFMERFFLFAGHYMQGFWRAKHMLTLQTFRTGKSYDALQEDKETEAYKGLNFQDYEITTKDDFKIRGRHIYVANPKGSILISNNNAGTFSSISATVKYFITQGFDVSVYDYPGYAKSKGTPSESALYNAGEAAYTQMQNAYRAAHGNILPASKILLFGHSMGASVANYLTYTLPSAGLIQASGFTDYQEEILYTFNRLPIITLLPGSLKRFFSEWSGIRFNSAGRMGAMNIPVFIIHGEGDIMVPTEMGITLTEMLPQGKRTLVTVSDLADPHNSLSNMLKASSIQLNTFLNKNITGYAEPAAAPEEEAVEEEVIEIDEEPTLADLLAAAEVYADQVQITLSQRIRLFFNRQFNPIFRKNISFPGIFQRTTGIISAVEPPPSEEYLNAMLEAEGLTVFGRGFEATARSLIYFSGTQVTLNTLADVWTYISNNFIEVDWASEEPPKGIHLSKVNFLKYRYVADALRKAAPGMSLKITSARGDILARRIQGREDTLAVSIDMLEALAIYRAGLDNDGLFFKLCQELTSGTEENKGHEAREAEELEKIRADTKEMDNVRSRFAYITDIAQRNEAIEQEILEIAHQRALAESGDMQRLFYETILHIEALQLIDLRNREDTLNMNEELRTVQQALNTARSSTQTLLTFENTLTLFPSAMQQYGNEVLNEDFSPATADNFRGEIIMPVSGMQSSEILTDLETRGVMTDGEVKPGIKIAFVGDAYPIGAADDDKIREMAEADKVFSALKEQGVDEARVLGPLGLREILNKGLADEDIDRVAYISSDNRLITGSGFISPEIIDKTAEIRKVGRPTEREVSEVLNDTALFISRVVKALGAEVITGMLEELKPDEDWVSRTQIFTSRITQDKEQALRDIGLTPQTIVQVLSLGWMIYGNKGILNNTSKEAYKTMLQNEKYNRLRQIPFGLALEIEEVKTQAETVAIQRESNITPVIHILPEGTILRFELDSETKAVTNAGVLDKPVTRLDAIPESALAKMRSGKTLHELVNSLNPFLGIFEDALKRIRETLHPESKNLEEKFKAMAAAA